MKAAIFWCVTPCILVNFYKLRTNLVLPLSGWNILKTGRYSETCRYLYQTTRRHLSSLKNPVIVTHIIAIVFLYHHLEDGRITGRNMLKVL